MALYQVTGTRRYRDHRPGEQFHATLERDEEQRAIDRRDIRVIDRRSIRLDPTTVRPPRS